MVFLCRLYKLIGSVYWLGSMTYRSSRYLRMQLKWVSTELLRPANARACHRGGSYHNAGPGGSSFGVRRYRPDRFHRSLWLANGELTIGNGGQKPKAFGSKSTFHFSGQTTNSEAFQPHKRNQEVSDWSHAPGQGLKEEHCLPC